MTRKHFEKAAEQVRFMQSADEGLKLRVANEFAEFFKQFNSMFDEDRFFVACFPKKELAKH